MQTIRLNYGCEYKVAGDGTCTACSNRFELGIVCAECKYLSCEDCSTFNKFPAGPKGLVYKCVKCADHDPADINNILDKDVRSISSPAERTKLLYQVVDGDKHNWAWHFCHKCQRSTDPNEGVLCTVCNVFYCDGCNRGPIQRPCDSCVTHIAEMKKTVPIPHDKPQCERVGICICKTIPPELKRLGVPSGGVRPKRS